MDKTISIQTQDEMARNNVSLLTIAKICRALENVHTFHRWCNCRI